MKFACGKIFPQKFKCIRGLQTGGFPTVLRNIYTAKFHEFSKYANLLVRFAGNIAG